jgi:Domain of unknown function (DUF4136)
MGTSHRPLVAALLISSCLISPVFAGKVKSYSGKNINFSQYKTYQWFPPRVLTKTGVIEDHPANPVLKESIGQQFSSRGMNEVAGDADLEIQIWALTESVPQLEAVILAAGPVYSGDALSFGDPVVTFGRYNRQGSLYIDLVDRVTMRSVWLGMATDSLPNGTMTPEELRGKLNKAVKDIFKKYPVKQK